MEKKNTKLQIFGLVIVALLIMAGCPNPTDNAPQDLRDNKNFTIELDLNIPSPTTVNVTDARTLGSTDLLNLDQTILDAIEQKIQDTFNTSSGPAQSRFNAVFTGNEAKIYIRNSGMGNYKLSAPTLDTILWHKDFLSTRDADDAQTDVRDMINTMFGAFGVTLPFNRE